MCPFFHFMDISFWSRHKFLHLLNKFTLCFTLTLDKFKNFGKKHLFTAGVGLGFLDCETKNHHCWPSWFVYVGQRMFWVSKIIIAVFEGTDVLIKARCLLQFRFGFNLPSAQIFLYFYHRVFFGLEIYFGNLLLL